MQDIFSIFCNRGSASLWKTILILQNTAKGCVLILQNTTEGCILILQNTAKPLPLVTINISGLSDLLMFYLHTHQQTLLAKLSPCTPPPTHPLELPLTPLQSRGLFKAKMCECCIWVFNNPKFIIVERNTPSQRKYSSITETIH